MGKHSISKRLDDTCFPNGKSNENKFSYQRQVAQKALDVAINSGTAVVAIACGGGKTTVSQWIINKYIQRNGQNSKILVITENNNALKDQYLEELRVAHIPIHFTFGEISSDQDVQVRVGIAANLHKLPWKEIDLIICDEAHRHYRKKRVQKFLKSIRVHHRILFTGTPSLFVKDNESSHHKSNIILVSGSELQERGLYSGVDLDVVRTANKKDPTQTIKDFIAHAKKVRADLTKTLLICPSIEYAESVTHHLMARGETVFLSTSNNDSDNKVLDASKKWNKSLASQSCFVVTVGKCSLGYNDAGVTTLGDLRSSLGSLCNNQQIFARVLRKSPNNLRKFYFRFSDGIGSRNYNAQVMMLVKLQAFMNDEIFSGFNGRNLKLELRYG